MCKPEPSRLTGEKYYRKCLRFASIPNIVEPVARGDTFLQGGGYRGETDFAFASRRFDHQLFWREVINRLCADYRWIISSGEIEYLDTNASRTVSTTLTTVDGNSLFFGSLIQFRNPDISSSVSRASRAMISEWIRGRLCSLSQMWPTHLLRNSTTPFRLISAARALHVPKYSDGIT